MKCLCCVKRTDEEDPRAVVWVEVTKVEGSKLWFKPPSLRDVPREGIEYPRRDRGENPRGWHFKLLPQTLTWEGS